MSHDRTASWTQVEQEAPELAFTVRACFAVRKHCTMATLRLDGAPRISGTEVQWCDGELEIGSIPGAVKARALQRDGRLALHSPTVDPPAGIPAGAWRCGGAADGQPRVGRPHRTGAARPTGLSCRA